MVRTWELSFKNRVTLHWLLMIIIRWCKCYSPQNVRRIVIHNFIGVMIAFGICKRMYCRNNQISCILNALKRITVSNQTKSFFIGLRSSKYYYKRAGGVLGLMGRVIWVWFFYVGRCVLREWVVRGGGLDGHFGEQGLPVCIQECLERFHRGCVDYLSR